MAQGFADPVLDSQAVFRAALAAMAGPGTVQTLPAAVQAPKPLSAAAAALALTLCDFETTLWLDDPLALSLDVTDFLRFHSGTRIVDAPHAATFALVADPAHLPDLQTFALGTPDYPDRSTTLILQVQALHAGEGWRLSGPGIDGTARLAVEGLRPDIVAQRAALAPLFPLGLDVFLVAGPMLVALPRTTVIEA